MRIQGKLLKYGTMLRYFSLVVLTFLYMQIIAFSFGMRENGTLYSKSKKFF